LWLAQTRSWMAQGRAWSDTPVATWQSAAERAAAGRARLSSRDQLLSDALLALGRAEVDRACRVWTRLTVVDPYDFASWYGLGNCLSRDDAVQHDPTTASGWRFRSSYQQAIRAYVRAFQLLPSIHRSLRGESYESVRQLLMTGGNNVRIGRAVAPDTTVFAARPIWQGDTLALLPYPRQASLALEVVPEAVTVAARHERELFLEVATAWVTAFPRSADALEALAIALEMLGNPAALDTLRRASALATTPADRLGTLEQQVDSAIDNALAAPLRQQTRLQWLARAATLAFPDYRFKSIPRLAGTGDYLLDGQAAFLRGDTAAVRRLFAELQT